METAPDRSASSNVQDPALIRLVEGIVRGLTPEAIYLFGSRSTGRHREGSDYDMLVVVPDDTPQEDLGPSETYALARAARVAADIVTCRRSGFDRWREEVGTLSYEATHFGRLVYGD